MASFPGDSSDLSGGGGDVSANPSGAAIEIVSLEEAKLHLRIDHTDEDDLIEGLITAAREWCEIFTRRQFAPRTYVGKLDEFPRGGEWGGGGDIRLPMPPLISVSSITYVDTSGTTQTLSASNYTVITTGLVGRIVPSYGVGGWPATRSQPNAVTITFLAGYTDGASNDTAGGVPKALKQACLLMIGHLYVNRAATISGTIIAEVPLAVESLLWAHRVLEVA